MNKLPLEILREKYLPVSVFPDKYGISEDTIMDLISKKKIRRAEFKAPGDSRRSLHVNYEEVLAAVGGEHHGK